MGFTESAHTDYVGSIPGSGRSPGRGNGDPLQYSCPRNPRDRVGHPWSDWACTVAVGWSFQPPGPDGTLLEQDRRRGRWVSLASTSWRMGALAQLRQLRQPRTSSVGNLSASPSLPPFLPGPHTRPHPSLPPLSLISPPPLHPSLHLSVLGPCSWVPRWKDLQVFSGSSQILREWPLFLPEALIPFSHILGPYKGDGLMDRILQHRSTHLSHVCSTLLQLCVT